MKTLLLNPRLPLLAATTHAQSPINRKLGTGYKPGPAAMGIATNDFWNHYYPTTHNGTLFNNDVLVPLYSSDGTSVTNEFHLTNERKKNSSSRTYPVEYSYDRAGRRLPLQTWRAFTGNAGPATTTWQSSFGAMAGGSGFWSLGGISARVLSEDATGNSNDAAGKFSNRSGRRKRPAFDF